MNEIIETTECSYPVFIPLWQADSFNTVGKLHGRHQNHTKLQVREGLDLRQWLKIRLTEIPLMNFC